MKTGRLTWIKVPMAAVSEQGGMAEKINFVDSASMAQKRAPAHHGFTGDTPMLT
jgi:hypothetical protein